MRDNDRTKQTPLYRSPLRILLVLTFCVFVAEVTVMFVLRYLPPLNRGAEAVVDALLLLVLIYPVFYFVIVRPMMLQIREREEAETALMEQKRFTEGLIQNSSTATIVIGRDHRVISWNRACEELTGIKAAGVIGTRDQWKPFYAQARPILADLVIDDKTAEGFAYYPAFGASPLIPEGVRAEGWFDRLGGMRRYLVFEAAPLFTKKDVLAAAIETIQDITDVKETEEMFIRVSEGIAMSTGEQFFRLLVSNLALTLDVEFGFVGVLKKDDPRTINTVSVYAHGAVAENFTYHLDNTPCSNVVASSLCVYPERVQQLFPDDLMLKEMAIESYAGIPLRDSGSNTLGILVVLGIKPFVKPALISSFLRVFAMRASAELERIQADRELTEMSRKLSTLIGHLQFGVVFEDEARTIALTNKAFCDMFGLAAGPEQLIGEDGRTAAVETAKLSRDPVAFLQRVEGITEKREIVTDEELYLSDGRIFERDYMPIRSDGLSLGHVWLYRDISERKRIEGQLLHSQKMEAVGELAGGIAHDFNNILTAVIGYGNLLKLRLDTQDPLYAYVENILNSAEKAASLTQSLLTFSRKQVIDPRPLNLNSVIERTAKFLSRLIGDDIRLMTVFNNRDLVVMADSIQIEQILMNLATNARDAMPEGGELTIETRAVFLDEEFVRKHAGEKPGMFALISVRDTGVGMDEEAKGKLFEPFFTTKEVGKGTGLGLAIVYGIIKQHEGFIEIESEKGRGTTFRILLPLIAETSEEKKSDDYVQVKKGSETILIAEDDVMIRELNRDVLGKFGYSVIVAKDGEEALIRYRENRGRIRMLLLDVVLPKKNGKEVYDEIKALEPGIKTLFMSGYTDDIIHKKGVLDKEINFISKPVSPMKLLQKVREVLDA